MDNRSKANILAAVLFIAVGCYVFYDTFTDFAKEGFAGGNAEMNSARYPRVLAGGLILLAILEIAVTVRDRSQKPEPGGTAAPAAGAPEAPAAEAEEKKKYGLALGTLTIFAGYVLLVDIFGYFLTTPVMLFGMFFLLGVRRIWEAAVLSVVTTVVLYVLFAIGLELILPYGTLFS
jgi:hypothetical protein